VRPRQSSPSRLEGLADGFSGQIGADGTVAVGRHCQVMQRLGQVTRPGEPELWITVNRVVHRGVGEWEPEMATVVSILMSRR
jgi:hypothetical protein